MGNIFITIFGVVLALLGILAVSVLFCVFVWVRVLGYPINLYFEKDDKK